MTLVTVKPKFQVTIPAKLRRQIDLQEGDLMEATIVEDGILLRPKDVVARNAAADRISSILAHTKPSSEDAGRSEDEISDGRLGPLRLGSGQASEEGIMSGAGRAGSQPNTRRACPRHYPWARRADTGPESVGTRPPHVPSSESECRNSAA